VAIKEKKMEILQQILDLIVGVGASVWDIIVLCSVFVFEAAKTLHTTMPRLEGLLAGLGLAWAMKYRDEYMVAKVLSTPLKLTLDGVNFLREQVTKLTKRIFSEVKRPFVWLSGKGKWLYESIKGRLASLKANITRKKD